MLTETQCAYLEQRARNCRDNARAEALVVEAFMPEYRKGLSGHPEASKETNARSMELYDFAIRGDHRARDFLRDAELYEAAAALGRASLASNSEATALSPDLKASQRPTVSSETTSPPTESHLAGKGEL